MMGTTAGLAAAAASAASEIEHGGRGPLRPLRSARRRECAAGFFLAATVGLAGAGGFAATGAAAAGGIGADGATGAATDGVAGAAALGAGVTPGAFTFGCTTAVGFGLLALLPGGQVKSSARPAGASTASPLTSTCAERLSPCDAGVLAPPASASALLGGTVKGTTGPVSGRAADLASPGTGASGPEGSATGVRLFM